MSKETKIKSDVHIPNHVKFIIGGISGMGATMVVQPLDLIKNRMQLSGEGGGARDYSNSVNAVTTIVKQEGLIGLYSGISANLFRQATYTTTRMGVFQVAMEKFKNSGHTGFFPQVSAGLLAGFIGAIISTPSDVALVRMTANGKLPPSERRNYKHIFDALQRIATEEGRTGIFAGIEPTVLRAMVANVSQLVSYTQAKSFLITRGYMEDNAKCHFASSLVSGLVYAFSSCPIDVAKTRIQYMKTDTGAPLYSGLLDALSKTVRKEGVTALWKGFGPLYVRIAPHTILLFVFVEKLTSIYKEKVMGEPGTGRDK